MSGDGMAGSFPVEWESPTDAGLSWRLLMPEQVPPMIGALNQLEFAAFGRGHAWYGRSAHYRVLQMGGYLYIHQVKPAPEETQAWEQEPPAVLAAAVTQPLAYWQQEMLPELLSALARLDAVPLATASWAELQAHLAAALALNERIEELNQPIGLMQSRQRRFKALHQELFGSDPETAVEHLLDGLETTFVERERALARLSGLAAAGQELQAELDEFLRRYGRRLEGRDLLQPSWLEDPSPVLARLQGDGWAAEFAGQVAARERTLAAVRARLAPDVRERYEESLRIAQEALTARSEHNYWMHGRCRTPLRESLLAFARRSVAAGVLAEAQEIWWLTPAELLAQPEPAPAWRELVAARRGEWERWAAVTPPPALGAIG